MLKIGIVIGSTRPNRVSPQVAAWVKSIADACGNAQYEIVDIKDYNLPLYDEPVPAAQSSDYKTPEAKPWSEKIASLDGFIFILPEYNRGIPSALKNAMDYLYQEFTNKAAGIVSYGSLGGVYSTAALRMVLSNFQVAVVQASTALNLFTDFEKFSTFKPAEPHKASVEKVLAQVVSWGTAMKSLRSV